MARLTHNDYLEQFSDSGVPGGLLFLGWVTWLFATLSKRVWRPETAPLDFALFCGLAGWFAQGFAEFALYIPALAWTAFLLGGVRLARTHRDSRVVR
jgi:O-antigen ligase